MKHFRLLRLSALLLGLLMLLSLSACGESTAYQKEVYAMDTVMTLTAYGPKGEAGLVAAEGVILSMQAMLDPELPTSTVYALNRAHAASVAVPGQIARMIQTAQTVYSQSN